MNSTSDSKAGLTSAEARQRLNEVGPNRLVEPQRLSFFKIFREEVTEPMILLLIFVGVMYSVWGKFEDAVTIFVIIIILTFVEVWNEYRAKKAIESLSDFAAPKARVVRDGAAVEVETEKVVPGDVLILNPGTRVPADANLLTAFGLQADESSLTGESQPVIKSVGEEVYAGTLVVTGEGKAAVFATGLSTKFGRISSLAKTIKPPKTPLQLAMKRLAKDLLWVALFFSVLVPLLGLLRGRDFRDMILTGLALAFATIPEEGPIIITMILGIGSYRLSKKNFLVKKIRAAEVLGSATVILTDKTGTLTGGEMRVASVYPEGREKEVVQAATEVLTEMSLLATDKAIMAKAQALNLEPARGGIVRELGFGNGRKTKAVIRTVNEEPRLFVSGAPEEVFGMVEGDLSPYRDELQAETEKGRRVIAVASRTVARPETDRDFAELEHGIELVGLLSLEDPPRSETRQTLDMAREAGIRTIMVTGDHPTTALAIAKEVGIPASKVMTGSELDSMSDEEVRRVVKETSVFARSTPQDKHRLLTALQQDGEVVAVTGDGVNDVLALKGASIGIAMGIKGTDAAKEAADVVLADDNYSTIARAVFEGRTFFDNLRKGFGYYLSVKAAMITAFLVPVVFNIPFPFAPVQIILLELFMDLAASSGFVAEPAEKTIYHRQPRKASERFINAHTLGNIAISGGSLFVAVMASYLYAMSARHLSPVEAQTWAFSAWIIGHVILAFVSRSETQPLYSIGVFSNRAMNIWAVGAFALLILVTQTSLLSSQLKLHPISPGALGTVFLFSAVAVFWRELVKMARYRNRARRPAASRL